MFEAERQAYLKALGIVQYTARSPIPGALESPVLREEQIFPPYMRQTVEPSQEPVSPQRETPVKAPEPAQSKTTPPPTEPAVTPQPVSTAGLKLNIPKELLGEPEATAQQATPAQSTQKVANPNLVEFCFAYIETGQGLSLLVELGDAGVKDMSASEHRLMGDILKALQIPLEQCRYHYFKWPLVNNSKIKQGLPEARETLVGYLAGKLSQQPATTLVVMGEMSQRVLDLQGQQMTLGDALLMTVKVPTLTAMMADWQHKAYTWRMLAPLRGRKI